MAIPQDKKTQFDKSPHFEGFDSRGLPVYNWNALLKDWLAKSQTGMTDTEAAKALHIKKNTLSFKLAELKRLAKRMNPGEPIEAINALLADGYPKKKIPKPTDVPNERPSREDTSGDDEGMSAVMPSAGGMTDEQLKAKARQIVSKAIAGKKVTPDQLATAQNILKGAYKEKDADNERKSVYATMPNRELAERMIAAGMKLLKPDEIQEVLKSYNTDYTPQSEEDTTPLEQPEQVGKDE